MTAIGAVSGSVASGYVAPAATDRRAAAAATPGNGLPEIQASLIWAKPLTVLSTYGSGVQGDLVAANGGFVAGYAKVDARGKVLSLTATGFLADPDKAADAAGNAAPPRPAFLSPAVQPSAAYQPPPAPSPGAQVDVKA